jgi:hypothetical protein
LKNQYFHGTGLSKRFHASGVLAIDFSHKIIPRVNLEKKFSPKNAQMAVFWNTLYVPEVGIGSGSSKVKTSGYESVQIFQFRNRKFLLPEHNNRPQTPGVGGAHSRKIL